MKITLNPDKEIVENIQAGLKAKGGYCPCRLEKTEDYREVENLTREAFWNVHPKTEVLLRPPPLTVFDGTNCFLIHLNRIFRGVHNHV